MDRAEVFLADIIANPDDLAPRLVYADWLEENGGDAERADFIRCAARLADTPSTIQAQSAAVPGLALPTHETNRIYNELWRRAWDLLTANETKWLLTEQRRWSLSRPRVPVIRGASYQFCCGFVGVARMPYRAWLQHGKALVRLTPLQEVQLSDKEPAPLDKAVIWVSGRCEDDLAHLPHHLFTCLSRGTLSSPPAMGGPFVYRHYDSREAAQTDLSDACLLYARGKAAGL